MFHDQHCSVDGHVGTGYTPDGCTRTGGTPIAGEWWLVDLQNVYQVESVSVTNRENRKYIVEL